MSPIHALEALACVIIAMAVLFFIGGAAVNQALDDREEQEW